MDMAGVQILLIKNDVLDTIWHDSLPILKYLGIIYFESLVHIELRHLDCSKMLLAVANNESFPQN